MRFNHLPEIRYFRENVQAAADGRRQAAIASKAGISPIHLNRILRGHSTPTIGMAATIAKALGVPLATLVAAPAPTPKRSIRKKIGKKIGKTKKRTPITTRCARPLRIAGG